MNRLLETHQSEIALLCERHHVKQLYAFGSILTEKFTEKSDVDFVASFHKISILDFADNYLLFCEELQRILNRSVHLTVDSSIRNPFFRKQVDLTKQLLFAA